MLRKSLFLLGLFFSGTYAVALPQTKSVSKVGCHITNSTCFVYVDGGITSSSLCTYNDGSFRWDGQTQNNGQSVLSILLAAQASGKTVTFGESGCHSGHPSFSYVTINQ